MWRALRSWLGEVKPCRKWAEAKLRGNCEPGAEIGSVAEPVNAWSGLAFVVAGLLVWAVQSGPEAAVFALAMAFLGVGTWLYHAHPSERTSAIDNAGIFATLAVLATYAVGQGIPALWLLMLVAGIGAGWALRFAFRLPLPPICGLFVWLTALAGFSTGSAGLTYLALSLFAWAYVAWNFDRAGTKLGRWGHGLGWHLGAAAAFAVLWFAV